MLLSLMLLLLLLSWLWASKSISLSHWSVWILMVPCSLLIMHPHLVLPHSLLLHHHLMLLLHVPVMMLLLLLWMVMIELAGSIVHDVLMGIHGHLMGEVHLMGKLLVWIEEVLDLWRLVGGHHMLVHLDVLVGLNLLVMSSESKLLLILVVVSKSLLLVLLMSFRSRRRGAIVRVDDNNVIVFSIRLKD